MELWEKIYCWKISITRLLRIETKVSFSKKHPQNNSIHEEQNWLGIG
jgi:hypothetical protein